jgi:hypothetical protein
MRIVLLPRVDATPIVSTLLISKSNINTFKIVYKKLLSLVEKNIVTLK